MSTGRWPLSAAAALTGLLLVGCGAGPGDPDESPPAPATTPSVASPSPSVASPSPGGDATPSATGTPGQDTEAVPVYWIGDSAQRSWLYREFLPLPAHPSGPVAAAVQAVTSAEPTDPDYRSGWSVPVTDVEVTETAEALTVDLPREAVADLDVASPEGNVTLQQLVWTVTAAAASDAAVSITVGGEPFVDALERDATVRGQVWVTSPQQDETVQAPVLIEGTATSFEGTLAYEITADATVVDEGTTTGGANGEFDDFSIEADLDPGTYTVSVFAPDASGGESGAGDQPFADTKDFVVAP